MQTCVMTNQNGAAAVKLPTDNGDCVCHTAIESAADEAANIDKTRTE